MALPAGGAQGARDGFGGLRDRIAGEEFVVDAAAYTTLLSATRGRRLVSRPSSPNAELEQSATMARKNSAMRDRCVLASIVALSRARP